MDITDSAVWFSIGIVLITTIITRVTRGRSRFEPACSTPPPPVVSCGSFVGLLHTLYTKGLRVMILDQYTKLGSVFTISFFGKNVTLLVGPEVAEHFYQGLESEIGLNMLGFTVPMTGKDVGYALDAATRCQQSRFQTDALRPSKLRSHVGPMLQEVEEYFAKWGQQGTVDLRKELEQVLMLISGRCLLGKEVRDNMFGEFFTLFNEMIDNGTNISNAIFPFAPTLTNRRRDRARAKISEMLTKIVRSRRSSNQAKDDVLQYLIDSRYRDGRPTTESEVTGMIIGLILAGKQTSSTTSTWTGARVLSHSTCLAAVLEEQKQIFKKYGDKIDYNILLEMDTLHRCIKEVLRMHPPTPSLFRKVHKSFVVRTKERAEYEIPKGHIIASPMLFNNNMPNIFKDPDVYDPARFGPEREEDKVGGKFSFTVFGGGRHSCLGEAYAYMQIKVIWSHLLRNFELKLVSPFPEMDWSKIMPVPKGKVMVTYKRRSLAST
ncbi:hypothetical protein GQ55_8G209700 [Panicum hallii var. hallii]|uniref:Obtusifoliol 14-alpha demethylase n=1 Tax=Panicum hallii var. hallii TaxID=1504633 RepID=A0A2T7CPU6_9POAL|nr:hypothetical protein GQ55_8G209700 [Panicum hallii var. hallii]